MFGRKWKRAIGEDAVNAADLAVQLAQNKRFRKQLLSAFGHASEVRRRTRRPSTIDTARRFARDQALRAELRGARDDLQRAYAELTAARRTSRRRKVLLASGLASLAAIPAVRRRSRSLIARLPTDRSQLPELKPPDQLTSLASRVRTRGRSSATASSRPLQDLTKDELYARAQEADIPGRSEMSKEQLIDALRARS